MFIRFWLKLQTVSDWIVSSIETEQTKLFFEDFLYVLFHFKFLAFKRMFFKLIVFGPDLNFGAETRPNPTRQNLYFKTGPAQLWVRESDGGPLISSFTFYCVIIAFETKLITSFETINPHESNEIMNKLFYIIISVSMQWADKFIIFRCVSAAETFPIISRHINTIMNAWAWAYDTSIKTFF